MKSMCLDAVVLICTLMSAIQKQANSLPTEPCSNEQPIIGIVSQALSDSSSIVKRYPWTKGKSYIAASYVKFVESSGARVVPIKDTLADSELNSLLGSLNGVIFPGGDLSLETSNYSRTATRIFDYAIAANKKNDFFPLLGLCWGLQMLLKLVAGVNLLQRTYSSHVDLKVQFTEVAPKSTMFKNLPSSLEELMTSQAVTYNNHHWGLYVKSYDSNEKIKDFFHLLALSLDLQGIPFGAAFESKMYPIYGLQWHPEKPLFEWQERLSIDHTFASLSASQYVANMFRKQTTKSCHKFSSIDEENKALIYNWRPINSAVAGSSFQQVYIV